MFHRIMIVCWSVFGLSVGTLLLGLAMYHGNRKDALDIAYTWQLDAVEMDAIYEELAQMLERGYERYAAALKEHEIQLQSIDSMDTATAKVIANNGAALREAKERLAFAAQDVGAMKENRHDAYVGVSVMGIGMAASIGILLWNLLCLLANWIWRGRSTGS